MAWNRCIAKCTLTLAAFCACNSAQSQLSSLDWHTAGDRLLTLDANTGLEWLAPHVTLALSFDYVSSQFGASGAYAGFRYATGPEIRTLFNDGGVSFVSSSNPADVASATHLIAQLGGVTFNFPVSGLQGISGIEAEPWTSLSSPCSPCHYNAILEISSSGFAQAQPFFNDVGDAQSFPDTGSFLVMRSPIPEPNPLTMFLAIGVASCAARIVRRQRHWFWRLPSAG
jgi:hypothetical protein